MFLFSCFHELVSTLYMIEWFHCSLLRQSAPLENIIREKLSAKQPGAYEWFWSDRVPMVVTTFVNYFERDSRFTAATSLYVVLILFFLVAWQPL